MGAIFAFKCSCCGAMHEGSPSFAFDAPYQYSGLSAEEKQSLARINSDLCTITHEGHTDYFIRTILEVPIHGVEEPFTWGIWVSLSEKSFARYVETYDDPDDDDVFFGWVCNIIPWYPKPEGALPSDVRVQLGGKRPVVVLHCSDGDEHPLVVDQREGISVEKAQRIAEHLRHEA